MSSQSFLRRRDGSFVEVQELFLLLHQNSHPPVWLSPEFWATGHTSQQTPAYHQGKRVLWDSSQLDTPNQHRSGLTINEQISLQLSIRLRSLQGKPWHAKTRPKLPKACQLQSVKNTVSDPESK